MKATTQIMFFCSMMTILSHGVWAYNVDGSSENIQKSKKVVGVVRMDGNKAVCSMSIEGYEFSLGETPICDDDEAKMALEQAVTGEPTRTAWITHAGSAVMGCLVGTGATMFGYSFESGMSEDGRGSIVGGVAAPMGLVAIIAPFAGSDLSGHGAALVSGIVVCAGGFNYLVYSERNS